MGRGVLGKVDMEMAKTPTVVVVGGVSQLVYESGNG